MLCRRTELKAHGSVPLCPPGVPPRERLQQLRGAEDLLARAAAGQLVLTGENLRAERQGLEREIAEVDALMEGCPGGPRVESAARAARAQLERCRGTLYLLAHLRLIAGDAPLLGGGRAGRSSLYGPRAGLGGGLSRRNSGRCGMLKAPKPSLLERYQSAFGALEMQHTGEGRMPVPRLSMASRRVLSWRARAEQVTWAGAGGWGWGRGGLYCACANTNAEQVSGGRRGDCVRGARCRGALGTYANAFPSFPPHLSFIFTLIAAPISLWLLSAPSPPDRPPPAPAEGLPPNPLAYSFPQSPHPTSTSRRRSPAFPSS